MKHQVALLGVGGIAQSHIQGWKAQGDAALAMLCDVRPEVANERKQRYDLANARVVTDIRDVLGGDCDLVDICTPSALHAEQAIACLRAGKHVLCEKPMADTLAEAVTIAAEAGKRPTQVYMCEHRFLFEPLCQAARGALGEIGRPHWFRMRSAHALQLSAGILKTGAFLDIGYHPLYTALHFMGPVKTAFGLKQKFARPDLADDTGLIVLEHERGGSIVEGSFAAVGPMGGNRPLEIYGERATLVGNFVPKPQLLLYRGAQGETKTQAGVEVPIQPGSWIANAIRHFLDCVDGKAKPLAGWREALDTMRAYDAALRSAQTGRKESVIRDP